MLVGLKVIGSYNFNNIFSPENMFNLNDLIGLFIILSIFPFIVKAFIVYFKIEKQEKNEKLKSEKYYQLLILELLIFITFLICAWWLALVVSLLICIILCTSNKIVVKKHINEEQIKNISMYTIKFKEVFIVSLLSAFESALLKIVFL